MKNVKQKGGRTTQQKRRTNQRRTRIGGRTMGRSGTKKCKYMKEEKDDIDIDQKKAKKNQSGKKCKKITYFFSIKLFLNKLIHRETKHFHQKFSQNKTFILFLTRNSILKVIFIGNVCQNFFLYFSSESPYILLAKYHHIGGYWGSNQKIALIYSLVKIQRKKIKRQKFIEFFFWYR